MDPDPLIFASDIEPRYVQLARAHALAARVERHISFDIGPFENLQPPAPTGLLVCNLPYGERLQEGNPTSPAFFERLGAVLKRYWSGWRAALLVADAAPHRAIGLRPTRRVPLMNGSIPCKLLVFELYAGSRREPGVHFKDKA